MTTLENALQANTKQLEVLDKRLAQTNQELGGFRDASGLFDEANRSSIPFAIPSLPEDFGAYF